MTEPFVLLRVEETTYAVRALNVAQVEMVEKITRVPHAPDYVDGVVTLRNEVVPVVSLRARFGLPRIPYDEQSRLLVVSVDNRRVALACDTARELVQLDAASIRPPPELVLSRDNDALEGVMTLAERLILVLDLRRVLNREEREQVRDALEKE